MEDYREDFKAIVLLKEKAFPLRLKDEEEEIGDGEKAGQGQKLNPKAIKNKITELIQMVHGSFESKQKIVEDFNSQNPECSKKSIEKKIKDLFIKDKKVEDPRSRWYATESCFNEYLPEEN